MFLKLECGGLKPLRPVVSNIIKERKRASGCLQIMDVSEVSLQATGNKKIIFLCDRVNKNDIQIKLTQHNPETRDIIWEHTVNLVKPCRFGGFIEFLRTYLQGS